jgi:hypothetical protein
MSQSGHFLFPFNVPHFGETRAVPLRLYFFLISSWNVVDTSLGMADNHLRGGIRRNPSAVAGIFSSAAGIRVRMARFFPAIRFEVVAVAINSTKLA